MFHYQLSVNSVSNEYSTGTTISNENFPDNQQNGSGDYNLRKQYTQDCSVRRSTQWSTQISFSGEQFGEGFCEEFGEEKLGKEEYHDSMRKLSDFTDAECGEPMESQHLRIDFTPVEGIDDNAELQEKCFDFWKFIVKEQRLNGAMVCPVSILRCKIDIPSLSFLYKSSMNYTLDNKSYHVYSYS